MSRETISYRELRRILLGRGFIEKMTVHHHLFTYPESDVMIVLPVLPRREVSKAHMALIRRTIVQSGIMTLEEFEELIEGKK